MLIKKYSFPVMNETFYLHIVILLKITERLELFFLVCC